MRTVGWVLNNSISITSLGLLLLLGRTSGRGVRTLGQKLLGLGKGRTKGRILYPQLIDEGPTFFPPAIGFICRSEGGIEEL